MKSLFQLSLALIVLAIVGVAVYATIGSDNFFDLNATKRLWEKPQSVSSVVRKRPTTEPQAINKQVVAEPTQASQPQTDPAFQKTASMLELEARMAAQGSTTTKTIVPDPTVKLLPTVPPYQPLPTRPPANVYWHPNPPAPTVPYGFSN